MGSTTSDKMAKGSSMSGASQNVNKGGSNAAGAVAKQNTRPSGANPKRVSSRKSTGGAMMGSSGGGLLRFYTDDAPGLKGGPVRFYDALSFTSPLLFATWIAQSSLTYINVAE